MSKIRETSEAVTRGVKITVRSRYLPERSQPHAGRYVFAYKVRVENRGDQVVRLRSRHWYISEEPGGVREVEGEGVVGQTPTLLVGQAFEYASGAALTATRGTMRGTFRMECADGTSFDAEIAPFALEIPYSLN